MIRALAILLAIALAAFAQPGPNDGKTFRGRIAYSADGNHNDEDDWAASPIALAIFAQAGLAAKLVHFDYNSILTGTDKEWEKQHATGVLGAVERYGYSRKIFFDSQRDREGAIASIARAIDASSESDPLYFIIAGPMEVAYLGIMKSNPAKRRHVFCISHSRWNDGFDRNYKYTYNKRSVIPSGIQWVQIRDQNAFFSTSPFGRPANEEQWAPWTWMQASADANVRFLWERMQATRRADCSDAGMAYFLVTGDESPSIGNLRRLLEDRVVPAPLNPRPYVRLEAENFLTLEGFDLQYENDRAVSHRINVRPTAARATLRTPFRQPYTARAGVYEVEVRHFGAGRYTLSVNKQKKGEWTGTGAEWTSQRVSGIAIRSGDEIAVEVEGASGDQGRLDYVQLDNRGPVNQR